MVRVERPSAPRPRPARRAAMRQPMPAIVGGRSRRLRRSCGFDIPDVVALAAAKRDLPIKAALENDVRLVRIEDGRLEIALEPQRSARWRRSSPASSSNGPGGAGLIVSNTTGQPTLRAQAWRRRATELPPRPTRACRRCSSAGPARRFEVASVPPSRGVRCWRRHRR